MCFGGLLTFLRSNLRFGGLESGRQCECEIRTRVGCSVVGLIESCIRGEGPSIVVLEESQAEVVACMTVQQRVYCTYPYSSGTCVLGVAAQSELDLRIYDAPCMLAGY
jgi:hypothetical protein